MRLLTCFSVAIYKYEEEIHSSKISKGITISELIYYCEQFVIWIRLPLQKRVHSIAWTDSSFGRMVCYSLSHLAFVVESVQLMGMYGSESCWRNCTAYDIHYRSSLSTCSAISKSSFKVWRNLFTKTVVQEIGHWPV